MNTTTIALIGNPNSGKTTLFNKLTGQSQFVGNWPGVTVEKKQGSLRLSPDMHIVDLPGIYSLTPFSPEEVVARDFLQSGEASLVLNIVDGTNLERNLYLTMQLLALNLPMVVAVNCVDVLRKRGDIFSAKALSQALGCPVIEISALRGVGIDQLQKELIGFEALAYVQGVLTEHSEATIAARYAHIEQIIRRCLRKSTKPDISQRIDNVLLHKWLALPIFIFVMFVVYWVAVSGPGAWASGLAEGFVHGLGNVLADALFRMNASTWLAELMLDGVLAGAGMVLSFVPQLLMVFLCLGLLEACGYFSRVAFMLDVLLRKFGLSGKCFMPMLLATGCSVPAILATRAIDCPNERRATAITCSFLPCSAKLPVIALFAGVLFGGAWWLAPLMYFVGMIAMLGSAFILTRMFKSPTAAAQQAFVLELTPYRLPSLKNLMRSTWQRTFSFIKKAGSVILLSGVFVWLLSGVMEPMGQAIAWVFVPLGFGTWQATIATITAFAAKENAVATLGVLYGAGGIATAFTPAAGLSFLLFNLLSMPCVAAVSALHRELEPPQTCKYFRGSQGKTKHTLTAIGYQCVLAYAVAGATYWAMNFL